MLTGRISIFSIFCFFSGFMISFAIFFSEGKFLNLETPARFEAPNSEKKSMSHLILTFTFRDNSNQNRFSRVMRTSERKSGLNGTNMINR